MLWLAETGVRRRVDVDRSECVPSLELGAQSVFAVTHYEIHIRDSLSELLDGLVRMQDARGGQNDVVTRRSAQQSKHAADQCPAPYLQAS